MSAATLVGLIMQQLSETPYPGAQLTDQQREAHMRSFDHGWHWQDVERTLEGRNLLIAQEGFQHSLSPNKQRRSVFPAYPPARQEEPDGAAYTPVNGGDPHDVADFREGREVSHELRHEADQTDLPSSTASERVSLLLSQIAKNQPTNTARELSPAEADQSDLPSSDNFVDEEVAPPVRKKKKLKPVPKQPVPNINIDLSFGQTAEQAWGHESLEHIGDVTNIELVVKILGCLFERFGHITM